MTHRQQLLSWLVVVAGDALAIFRVLFLLIRRPERSETDTDGRET